MSPASVSSHTAMYGFLARPSPPVFVNVKSTTISALAGTVAPDVSAPAGEVPSAEATSVAATSVLAERAS
ncbi:MAG: hypothetical protein R2705_05450 [Ilumatobacteraceae bacterium]